jgi:hypothetical protein
MGMEPTASLHIHSHQLDQLIAVTDCRSNVLITREASIARNNPSRAMSFGYELISETDRLQGFPEPGRIVPNL